MNGAASRRIRRASHISGRPVGELKREYKGRPYHRRVTSTDGIPKGVPIRSHVESDRFWHWWQGEEKRRIQERIEGSRS